MDLGLHERYAFPIIHNHAFFEIIYVYSGTCVNHIGETSLEMKAGDVCFLAPDTMHALAAVHDEDVVMNLIVSRNAFEHFFFGMLREKNLLSDLKNAWSCMPD
ncbi:AraC family ligand binding domain-containing protein [Mediterraneibacter glycyrrhizinilyticus]|nr:AraC family ligand binding domain-containing protein [Mediterraneibacter glycyrrhizinilyticus]